MRFGRSRWNWYDIVLIGLAAVIVYPDKVLDWLAERVGRELGWFHLILIEVVAAALMTITMVLLMPVYPNLAWWYPVFAVFAIATFRFIGWLIKQTFGFED